MKIMTKEEAIQILSTRDAHGVLCGYTSGVTEALDMAVEALRDKPKGKWILVCDGGGECDNLYRCSHCGQEVGCEEYDKPKFCGECGADMRGAKATKGGWREQPITEKQKEYINDMQEFSYYPLPKFTGTTKGEASDYIEKYRELAHENVNSPTFGY